MRQVGEGRHQIAQPDLDQKILTNRKRQFTGKMRHRQTRIECCPNFGYQLGMGFAKSFSLSC